jgi:tetratricopeptide (TPR) repeat protein
LKSAGTKAMQSYSVSEAFQFYKQAYSMLHHFPKTNENEKEKLELLHMMTAPMSILGFPKDALPFLQDGENLSKELGDRKSIAIFYSMLGAYYRYSGQHSLERHYAEKGLELAKELEDVAALSRIYFNACSVHVISGEWEKEIDVASTAKRLMERTETESAIFDRGMNVYSMLCGFLGVALGMLGNFEEALIYCEKGLKNAADIDDIITLGHLEWHFSIVLLAKGDWDQAIAYLRRSINYLEETKAVFMLSLAWSMLGDATSFIGDFEAARRYVDKGLKMQTDARIEFYLAWHYVYSCSVYLNMGDLENALDHIQTALDLSEKNKELVLMGLSYVYLGRTTGKKDPTKWNEAKDFLLEGIHIFEAQKARPFHSQGYLFLGELYADISHKKEALENLELAEQMFKEMGMDYWLAKTREILKKL